MSYNIMRLRLGDQFSFLCSLPLELSCLFQYCDYCCVFVCTSVWYLMFVWATYMWVLPEYFEILIKKLRVEDMAWRPSAKSRIVHWNINSLAADIQYCLISAYCLFAQHRFTKVPNLILKVFTTVVFAQHSNYIRCNFT